MKPPASRLAVAVALLAGATFVYWYWWRPVPIVNRHPGGREIVALGDSLTAGVGSSRGHDYVSVLAQKIGQPILNRGVSGDTTADALARLDRDVLSRDARIVIVFLGGNDVLRSIPPEQTFSNLDQIIRQVQARGAMVVLVDVRPPLFGGKYGRRFRRLARERGAVLVPDILGGRFTDRKLKADELHFNDDGYAIVADRICAAMKPYLN